MSRSLLLICLGLLMSTATLPVLAGSKFAINYEDVVKRAKSEASKSWKQPREIPRFMRELSYSQYQDIRFNPDKSVWKESGSNFQVMLVPPGLFYTRPVQIHVVDAKGVKTLPFDRKLFNFTDQELAKRIPPDLGYAGLKLTYPLKGANEQNQFLVFAGASYFRGVGRDNAWGISARGLAVDTGLPSGEDFPSFTEFWLLRPATDANVMVVYGLLDSPNVTGAYEFTVIPGNTLQVAVRATLFPRNAIKLAGIAPLTSMFFYGENTSRPRGEWRTQVHDSDGLLIHNGVSGEWLWRPLQNPKNLEMDYFATENIKGFGLIQRDDSFNDYHDLGAHYHERPSTWVEPAGEWGKGHVVLVQLPTPDETNDNIVAFWTPETPLKPKTAHVFSYKIFFGKNDVADEPVAQAVNTFVGDGNIIGGGQAKGAYRIIVDFRGGELDKLSPQSVVMSSVTAQDDGEVIEHFVEYNPSVKGWRLSILAKPEKNKSLALRAFLKTDDKALTETWNYRLPAENDILVSKE